jgi:hydrogenase maturation protease
MSLLNVERVAEALLYEGYMLYPYRPSSVKNRQRFNFGVVYPERPDGAHAGTDPTWMQTECLLEGDATTVLDAKVRFLQLIARTTHRDTGGSGDDLWQEAIERDIELKGCALGDITRAPRRTTTALVATSHTEPLRDAAGATVGTIIRRQRSMLVELELSAAACGAGLFRVHVRFANRTALAAADGDRDEIMLHACASAHAILRTSGGAFVSLLDPPESLRDAAARCHNVGTWPVLAGDPGERDTVLSSPIIVYDYPEIAPESAGDLFEATEIDEILSLRILSLSDAEKREMAQSDERARRLLERTESLTADQLMRMHGAMRSPRAKRGDRVRLHPHPRGDVFDLALADQIATVDKVEQDLEGRVHIAVIVDQDPGRSIGPRGPAHRFFFAPDELELLGTGGDDTAAPGGRTILVAGIGNIFLGDDGFGVEVVQRLARRRLPDGVIVADFGIRGYDLAYALMGGHDHVILVDACPRGDAPGTVYVVEPDLASPDASGDGQPIALDAHDMNPMHVLNLARSLGAVPEHVLLVGCEPATLGPEEGLMGLSAPVEGAVNEAVTLIESLVVRLLAREQHVDRPAASPSTWY